MSAAGNNATMNTNGMTGPGMKTNIFKGEKRSASEIKNMS